MRVFVTGGTGFVGPAVVRAVRDAGHEVTLLVHSHAGPFSESERGIHVALGDVTDAVFLDRVIAGHDAVVHLVAIRRAFPERGLTFERMHTEATRLVVAAAQRAGVSRFIFMSASGVDDDVTAYQRTKLASEGLVKSSGIPWTIFRPTTIAGKGEAGARGFDEEFADIIRKAPVLPSFGGGGFPIQPVALADVAEAFARALTEPRAVGKTYLLAGPDRFTWNEYLRTLAKVVGKSRVLAPAPLPLVLGVAKAFERFAWFPASRDEIWMLTRGPAGDGSAAARDLGIQYTPYRDAVRFLEAEVPPRRRRASRTTGS